MRRDLLHKDGSGARALAARAPAWMPVNYSEHVLKFSGILLRPLPDAATVGYGLGPPDQLNR